MIKDLFKVASKGNPNIL